MIIYAIGDIHGKAAMLGAALTQIKAVITPEDTVVFLGDYIDRGEDSKAVIDMALDFRTSHANTVFLRGNHEQMLLDTSKGDGSVYLWVSNGGIQTLASYGTALTPQEGIWQDAIPDAHLDFFRATQLEWESDSFHFVHAGLVPPSQRENKQFHTSCTAFAEPRLWVRDGFINSDEDFGKVVVFGHTIQRSGFPLVMPNKIGIDTGAFTEGGRLSSFY